jgi:hypothetical protein
MRVGLAGSGRTCTVWAVILHEEPQEGTNA